MRPSAAPRNSQADTREDVRAGVSRTIVTAVRNGELTAADKSYIGQIVAARTGLNQNEAEARVDAAFAQVRRSAADLEQKTKEAADKARRTALITGFLTAASLLISCAVAAMAAGLGGRHRDEETPLRVFDTQRFW